MTRPLREADANRILDRAIGVLTALRAAGVKEILRQLDQDRDGLRGTDYDALRGGGSDESPTERAALHAPPVTADTIAAAIYTTEHVVDTLALAVPVAPAPPPARQPGQGPARSGCCTDHWTAGIVRLAARKRYRLYCRRCGDHRNRHGVSFPAPVLQAAHATKAHTPDGTEDWQHWSVDRAWQACGGRPVVEATPAASTQPEAVTSPDSASLPDQVTPV